ncbi:MAG: sigma-70 family RNA polymerase sigma factor [Candidatus Latescibacterota bacterium]|nr:MAG: sigma-70 family RNA polymerase sigma factor [Candidatus Latescibacterota bacterium]
MPRTGSPFPPTRASVVQGVRSDDPETRKRAYTTLVESYWRPVYTYVRLQWRRDAEQAQDLTQEFLARVVEKEFLGTYEPGRSRLRTFVRTCLDRLVQNADRDARRLKRGGGFEIRSLDFGSVEGELSRLDPPDPNQGEAFFEREWIRGFFGSVVEELRLECEESGKQIHFQLFERYDLEEAGATYESLARDFELSSNDVTNRLAYARRTFRRIALERLRTLTGDEAEFRAEARTLLGVDVS